VVGEDERLGRGRLARRRALGKHERRLQQGERRHQCNMMSIHGSSLDEE
jgi:hypothetical protein